ncbi:MAG: FG-GAP-like repeat-containing protein, partial [Bacteroidota bacterium]
DHNLFGLGTRVEIRLGEQLQLAENQPSRGFQSASEPLIHFGLGEHERIDELKVIWPDGHMQILTQLSINQVLHLKYDDAAADTTKEALASSVFQPVLPTSLFSHQENKHDDFATERLLPHATSQFGPGLATGDVNKDGLNDFYVGGAKGQAGVLFLQQIDGQFIKSDLPVWETDKAYEDLDALFFDANGDGWDDLYIVSGGSEAAPYSSFYQDRFYWNQQGHFVKAEQVLPTITHSGSKVKACDIDADGDLDVLIGGRLVPQNYGQPATSVLLLNEKRNGQTVFTDVTATHAPDLQELGMVTDFVWTDFDQNGTPDLVMVGEWMPVSFFKNEAGHLYDVTPSMESTDTRAWWFSIAAEDLNEDGRDDLVLGNLGQNYKYQAADEASFDLYVNDFDANEQNDIVLSYHYEGEQFPLRGRQCSSEQMPGIKEKFKSYNEFAAANLTAVYSENALEEAEIHFSVSSFASQIWWSNEDGNYNREILPPYCQLSAINAIIIEDVNQDGRQDLILGGNLFASEVETKRNDASIGVYLQATGSEQFEVVPYAQSGLLLSGDVKDMAILPATESRLLIVANNDDDLQILKF